MELKERIAIVTGGGQGIGEAISCSFGAAGAKVVVADIHLESAQRVVDRIGESHSSGMAVKVDVANLFEVENMVKQVLEKFGRIDILVNNAGISPRNPEGGRTPVYEINDDELMETIPLKRFAKPEELANVAFFLVSESASYVTGEILDVNGGCLID